MAKKDLEKEIEILTRLVEKQREEMLLYDEMTETQSKQLEEAIKTMTQMKNDSITLLSRSQKLLYTYCKAILLMEDMVKGLGINDTPREIVARFEN